MGEDIGSEMALRTFNHLVRLLLYKNSVGIQYVELFNSLQPIGNSLKKQKPCHSLPYMILIQAESLAAIFTATLSLSTPPLPSSYTMVSR